MLLSVYFNNHGEIVCLLRFPAFFVRLQKEPILMDRLSLLKFNYAAGVNVPSLHVPARLVNSGWDGQR